MNFKAPASTLSPRAVEKLLTGAVLTFALGLAMQGVASTNARSAELPSTSNSIQASRSLSSATKDHHPLQDGVYLYGQSSKANQIGSAYLVFEVRDSKVVGAFYMPRSSFDCFHGTLQTDRLALKVRNSYEKVDYPYSVALQAQTVSASAANPAAAPIGLEGYSQIKQLSSGDKQILSTCKAALK